MSKFPKYKSTYLFNLSFFYFFFVQIELQTPIKKIIFFFYINIVRCFDDISCFKITVFNNFEYRFRRSPYKDFTI